MYRGFDLKLENLRKDQYYRDCHAIGSDQHQKNFAQIRPYLSNFLQKDKYLDGGSIQKAWFPQIKADVFISHAHKNLELALFLAGWFQKRFNLKAFIDACVWGHSNDLLWKIDTEYCIKDSNLFSYELRNHSTSHVHMMLSTALNMMMDKTECVFFLNTPDSVRSYGSIDKTESPWLYAEIAATHFLAMRIPERRKEFIMESTSNFSGTENFEKSLKIVHPVDLSHLNKLNLDKIISWSKSLGLAQHPLDVLYDTISPLT